MDVYKTHGAFSWCELMTPDPQAALTFYRALFGWTSEDMDMGTGAYHVVKVGDSSVGGVMAPPPGSEGMPSMWGVYVTVDDIDATAWGYQHARETDSRHGAKVEPLGTFTFTDVWEWEFKDYHWWFLWACHAIVWGIAQYDAAKAPAVVGGAA